MQTKRSVVIGIGLLAVAAYAGSAAKLPLNNRKDPVAGITTAGQLTPEEIRELRKEGFKTVINLRPSSEKGALPDEAEQVAKAGLRYLSLPVAGAEDVTEANARKLADLLSGKDALPAVVHCGSGNRVGALLALKAFYVDGKDVESSIAFGKQAGLTGLEPAVRAKLVQAAAR